MKKYFFVMLSVLFLFSACNNEKTSEEELDEVQNQEIVETSQDAALSQNLLEAAAEEADYQIEYRSGGNPPDECPIITRTGPWNSYPNTVTIDWGTEGCEGARGNILKGKIIVEITGPINEEGSTRTKTTEDFSINDVQIEGTRVKTNTGTNSLGNHSFSRIVNVDFTFPNGDNAHWEAEHFLVQTEGGGTPTMLDNAFEITGSSSGINRHGSTYVSEIIVPLVKRKDCGWVESGTRTIVRNDNSALFDYGDGSCNRIAELTLPNGQTRNIVLQRWW